MIRAAVVALLVAAPAFGQPLDPEPRLAVMSAYPPEWQTLQDELTDATRHTLNGKRFLTGRLAGQPVVLFLSGVSMVNAAMTTQLALDRFEIEGIVFSGIAGGVDPSLEIGDVVVAEQWGQYLESIFARETAEGYAIPPWMSSDFANYGMMFPHDVTVESARKGEPEPRFWFPVDSGYLAAARTLPDTVSLASCTPEDACLNSAPKVVVGGNGVSGAAFVDNAEFRKYAFDTFEARVLDMESAAVAHVAYANQVPFIAFRSLSDLAGGGEGDNELPVFLDLAAGNSAKVVTAFIAALE